MREAADFIGVDPSGIFNCCNENQLRCKNFIAVYHGDKLEDRRSSITSKSVDIYDAKTKQFIKTFNTITSLKKELGLYNNVVNRCLRTNNHLAGDYLIVPHGMNVE